MIIKHNKPCLSDADYYAVLDNLKTENITQGSIVKRFEKKFSKYIGKKFGIAVNSGTNALFLALKALKLKKKSQVIIPSYVCSSVINSIRLADLNEVIVDVERNTYNIDYEKVKKVITSKTGAIILPHIYGVPVNIEPFLKLNIPIVEDCAQAIGAKYKGGKVGSYGIISVFSFYATKLITTGQGGMILTNDKNIKDYLFDITDYDKRKDYKLRYNFKLTDFQAAMGMSQLNNYDNKIKKRESIALRYLKIINNYSKNTMKIQSCFENAERVWFRFVIETNNVKNWIEIFKKHDISIINPTKSCELLHNYLKLNKINYVISEKISSKTISIPIYPCLSDNDLFKIEECLKKCCLNLG